MVVHSKSNQFDVETSRTNQLLRSLQDVIAVLEAQACRPWGLPGDFGKSLTLSQPRGADYVHQICDKGTPGFSDLPTALRSSSM